MNRNNIPAPPVPQFLREALKGYPEIIDNIQDVLTKASKDSPYFDWAITRLEDTLEARYGDARRALEAAEQSGNRQAIDKARVEYDALVVAGRGEWIADDALANYYEAHKGVWE